jgi:hypothetical protein
MTDELVHLVGSRHPTDDAKNWATVEEQDRLARLGNARFASALPKVGARPDLSQRAWC